ncbi:MAG TPA: Fic family protein [Thermomicrobiaceae bacterium]|nr:Fic family protein [Thermomicrobiaceae bacterium]
MAEEYLKKHFEGVVPSGAAPLCLPDELRSLELRNQVRLAEYVTNFRRRYEGRDPLHVGVILEMHRITVDDIYSSAGRFRDATEDVIVPGAGFTPAAPSAIEYELVDLLDRARFARAISHPLSLWERLEPPTRAFHRFLQIHPFLDGNGRVGRALLLLMLYDFGLLEPPEQIFDFILVNRDRYLEVLKEADQGPLAPLLGLMATPIQDWHLQRVLDELLRLPQGEIIFAELGSEQQRLLDRAYRLTLSQDDSRSGYQQQIDSLISKLSSIIIDLANNLT